MDMDDLINPMLIECVKEYPTLHNTDVYTENDDLYWTDIQSRLGVHKSWLKRRLQKIRNEHRKITVYNHIHSSKVPPYKWSNSLNFLIVDLNGFGKMNFDDLINPKEESFHITQEMLSQCDINEKVTAESISNIVHTRDCQTEYAEEMTTVEPEEQSIMIEEKNPAKRSKVSRINQQKQFETSTQKRRILSQPNTTVEETNDSNSANNRDEDAIFIELIAAMLKKLNPEERKRTKKEIMNVLL